MLLPICTYATLSACVAQVSSMSSLSERSWFGSMSAGTPAGYDFSQILSIYAPSTILLKKRLEPPPKRVQHQRLAASIRGHPVLLHERGVECDLPQQEWHERQVVLFCDFGIHVRELGRVTRTIVRRYADPDEQHARAGRLGELHHFREIFLRGGKRQAAQAIVRADFENHHAGLMNL